jgi:hypothetical protein
MKYDIAKTPALDENTTAKTVRMRNYDNSLTCVDQCVGCDKRFDHALPTLEGNAPIVTAKCLAYSTPAAMWPREGEKFAMETVLVRDAKDGKVGPQLVPIIEKYCALANHYVAIEKIKSSKKILVGQQKQGRG